MHLFFLFVFWLSTFLHPFFAYSEDLFEENCECYTACRNPIIDMGTNARRPGIRQSFPQDRFFEELNWIRALYNHQGSLYVSQIDHTFTFDHDGYLRYVPRIEFEKFAAEGKQLSAIYNERTGRHIKNFSEFQAMFEYAERWVDLNFRADTELYKAFVSKERPKNPEWWLGWAERQRTDQLSRIEADREYASRLFEKLHETCISKHACLRTYYENAFLHTSQGNTARAIEATNALIETSQRHSSQKYLTANTYLQLGIQCAQAHEFSQAIEALSQAIDKDPENKIAYLERAACYFEMGNFDLALQDYIVSGAEVLLTPVAPQEVSYFQFSQGMMCGAASGLKEGAKNVPLSLFHSVYGTGHFLWTMVKDPIGVPRGMIISTIETIEYLRTQDLETIAHLLAPEICELVRNWDRLDSYARGEKMGVILGKYGVEIFSRSCITRLTNTAQKLRHLTISCNLKTATRSSADKAKIITQAQLAASTREQYLTTKSVQYRKLKAEQHFESHRVDVTTKTKLSEVALQNQAIKNEIYFSTTKVHWDSQGKHIKGHRNYENLPTKEKTTKALWTPDQQKTEEILKKHAGKGHHVEGIPGEPGYKEIIDCGENIGRHVSQNKPNQAYRPEVDTQYATIHYRKDGYAHLVPAHPDKWEKHSK